MCMWSQYCGHLFLRQAAPEDVQLMESEKGLADLGAALKRLRRKFAMMPTADTLSCQDECATSPRASSQALTQIPEICGASCSGASIGVDDEDVPLASQQQYQAGAKLVYLAELMHIWRPVIYTSLLHRYGQKSWIPWLGSLSVDLASPHLLKQGKHMMHSCGQSGLLPHPTSLYASYLADSADDIPKHAPTSLLSLALLRSLSNMQWTPGEERELEDRKRKMLLYLLRSPFLDSAVMRTLDTLRVKTARLPLLGSLIEYATEMTGTFTAYYTYTAGS
eukprot:gene23373-30632_t